MRQQLGRVFLELRARGRRQGQDRVGDQGQLGGEAGPPVLGAGLDVPVHPQDGDVPGSEGRQSRPALPVLGPHGVPHGPAVADTPELVHLAVDCPDHLLDVAPDGGETDGPGAGAGPDYDGAVAGPELLPDGDGVHGETDGPVHCPALDVPLDLTKTQRTVITTKTWTPPDDPNEDNLCVPIIWNEQDISSSSYSSDTIDTPGSSDITRPATPECQDASIEVCTL